MALTIYPLDSADSFIEVVDADTVITNNSIQSADWLALNEATKEVYLRIATQRIIDVAVDLDSDTYVEADSCLSKACAMMAIHDLAYGLSSSINPNMGTITKERVGDLEVNYQADYKTKGRKTNPFPSSVVSCLNSYGANVSSSNRGFYHAKIEKA